MLNRNVRPGMFGLVMVMVAIDMYGKSLREWYTGLRERMYFIIFVYYANIKVFHIVYFSLFFIYLYVSFLLACD